MQPAAQRRPDGNLCAPGAGNLFHLREERMKIWKILRDWRILFALAACAMMLAVGGMPANAVDAPSKEQQEKDLANVPKDALQYYKGYWFATQIVSDPLKDWTPHKGPWQICHN